MQAAGRGRGAAALVVALAALVGGGCLLSTRDPETPSTDTVPWKDPLAPDDVLLNIRVSISGKSLTKYLESLADSFRFVPNQSDELVIGSGYFDDWSKQDESRVFGNIFQMQGSAALTYAWPTQPNEIPDPDHPEDYLYENITYRMTARRPTAPPKDSVFTGRANLYLRRYGTQWKLLRWEDIADGDTLKSLGLVRWQGKIWS